MRGACIALALAAVVASSCGTRVRLEVPASAPRKGSGGRVVIQEAGDFQCPFCGRVQPTIRALMTAYAGRVDLLWRNYPLSNHPHAALAAEAALEIRAQAGDAKFWAFHDALFANQDRLARASLEQHAEALGGIDMERFRRALDTRVHRPAVVADAEAIGRAAGDVGAPCFFIDGRVIEGAQPYAAFEDAVESALRR